MTQSKRYNTLLNAVLDDLHSAVEYDAVIVFKLENDYLTTISHRGAAADAVTRRWSFPLRAWENLQNGSEDRPLVIMDAHAGSSQREVLRTVTGVQLECCFGPFRSWVCLPLLIESQMVGLAVLAHHHPAYYLPERVQEIQRLLADMAVSFQNAILHARSEQRAEEIQMLFAVQQAITSQLELDKVLQTIADSALRLTRSRRSMVFLLEGNSLILKVLAGEFDARIKPGYRMSLDSSLTGLAMESRELIRGVDPLSHDRVDTHISQELGTQSFIIMPLISSSDSVGAIVVTDRPAGTFGPEDERVLNLLAPAAVIGLENARLYAESKKLARLRERHRIAQSLHDTVAQMLFRIGLEAKQALDGEQLDEHSAKHVRTIKRLAARGSYEVRSAIYALRSRVLTGGYGLIDLLQDQVDEFSSQSNMDIGLIVRPNCRPLPRNIGEAVYRVTREALSNVRRHSKATAAVVSLECSEGQVKLIVQDNGVGILEMCPLFHGDNEMCFGISTMRNVTEQVGGSFLITNNDDGGAMVKASFRLPVARPK